jgi:clan AA aspartic protease (TIGR02281 family)
MTAKPFAYGFIAMAAVVFFQAAAFADLLADGVSAYNKHNYQLANMKFEQAVKAQPNNSNAYYYLAVVNQALGNVAKARQYYQLIVNRFPSSQAGALAAQALGMNNSVPMPAAGGASAGHQSASSATGGNQGSDSIPEESKVYFTLNENHHMMIDVLLNGRPMRCCLDTGAGGNLFDKNQLLAAGINPPTGPPTSYTSGWAQTATPVWGLDADVQIGKIKRHVPVMVQENLGSLPCLIGQTFFGDLQYAIDSGGGAIIFHGKKGAASAAASSQYDLPFEIRHGHMFVKVEVDGHSCTVFLDTGAYATIFTQADLERLGLSVPEGSPTTQMGGIDGSVIAHTMTVDHLRLGPILQHDVAINVIASGDSCLGQNVLNGWRYSIDNDHHCLKFFH